MGAFIMAGAVCFMHFLMSTALVFRFAGDNAVQTFNGSAPSSTM